MTKEIYITNAEALSKISVKFLGYFSGCPLDPHLCTTVTQ
jgi:hypothetical protein